MSKFVVHTDVPVSKMGVNSFHQSVPKMLTDAKLSDVSFGKAYPCALAICHCTSDRKMVCEFDSNDRELVRQALQKIGLPFTAVMEAK